MAGIFRSLSLSSFALIAATSVLPVTTAHAGKATIRGYTPYCERYFLKPGQVISEREQLARGKTLTQFYIEEVLQKKVDHPSQGRTIDLTRQDKIKLINATYAWMQRHADLYSDARGTLQHIGRHIHYIGEFANTLTLDLGIDHIDTVLIALLHDLGKLKAEPNMEAYLKTAPWPNPGVADFFVKVLGHELYSFHWMVEIAQEAGLNLSPQQFRSLADHIARHNFSQTNVLSPQENEALKKHFWPTGWKTFADFVSKITGNTIHIDPEYGSPDGSAETVLQLNLNFWDRFDGGLISSSGKYLITELDKMGADKIWNADYVAQKIQGVVADAKLQVKAAGAAIAPFLLPDGPAAGNIHGFSPYNSAIFELNILSAVAEAIQESNSEAGFARHGLSKTEHSKTILISNGSGPYQLSGKGPTYRIDLLESGAPGQPLRCSVMVQSEGKWMEITESRHYDPSRPMDNLIRIIYEKFDLKDHSRFELPSDLSANQ